MTSATDPGRHRTCADPHPTTTWAARRRSSIPSRTTTSHGPGPPRTTCSRWSTISPVGRPTMSPTPTPSHRRIRSTAPRSETPRTNTPSPNNGSDSYALRRTGSTNTRPVDTGSGGSTPPANGTDCTGHAEAISYDCNGNLTGDGTLTLTYDPENRLDEGRAKTGMTASYLYDPLGRQHDQDRQRQHRWCHQLPPRRRDTAEIARVRRHRQHPAPLRAGPRHRPAAFIAMVTCIGSGNSCAGTNATKTMFHVDKLGSVVAMSNASNGQLATNGRTVPLRRLREIAPQAERRKSTTAGNAVSLHGTALRSRDRALLLSEPGTTRRSLGRICAD